jgi:hypothetical protein
MYYSIIISVLLTAGTCLAFAYYVDFKNTNADDALATFFNSILYNSGKYIRLLSIILMIVTTFLGFLATTRYLYSLPDDIKSLEFIRNNTNNNVSKETIFIVFALCALAILINHTSILVEISDLSLIVTLLLVASSTFIDNYKNESFSVVDLCTSGGFLYVLLYRWLKK